MKRIVVDTNVLVSFLTDRDAAQQRLAAELLEGAVRGELRVVLPQIVATELIYVLMNLYGRPEREVARVVQELIGTPGVETVDSMPWPIVFDFWPARVPGFADGAIAAIARSGKHDAVATFDSDLERRLEQLGLASYWSGA